MARPFRQADTPIVDLHICPDWRGDRAYEDGPAATLPPAEMDRAAAAITAWPQYRPSPLRRLSGLAKHLGLAAVVCKDESGRFGAGGVKALGAPYGLEILLDERRAATGRADFTAVAATDGNHGLALAWAAARTGCRAIIFVGRDVEADRIARIRAFGADVEVVDGTYDNAVRTAERRTAANPDMLLVTDTDYVGGSTVCRAIMAGYALLAAEAWEAGLSAAPPTHVFLQCGVGGMAAGVAAGLWRRMGSGVPRVVTVEPTAAACILASLRAGRPVAVPGDLHTRMVGLACGRPSLPAWEILSRATFAAMALAEEPAETMRRRLIAGSYGDGPLAAGDTGVAGIAGMVAAAAAPETRTLLGLNASSRILVVNSDGPLPAVTATGIVG